MFFRRIEIRRYNMTRPDGTMKFNQTIWIYLSNVLIINALCVIRWINPPLHQVAKPN